MPKLSFPPIHRPEHRPAYESPAPMDYEGGQSMAPPPFQLFADPIQKQEKSPRMESAPTQRMELEEEEEAEAMQMKADVAAQRMDFAEEDEEAMQMKAYPAQRMELEEEDEAAMQMKAYPAQRMELEEEDEAMQMKAYPAQRMELEEEDEAMQMKAAPVQRMELEEEDAPLQAHGLAIDEGYKEGPMQFQREAVQREEAPAPVNNTGMPDQLKSGIENLSGYDMSDVKVHYNSDKPAQLQAHAYAQGTDIHVGPGQEQHLPHEAWHVVQQKQGRVQPTMQLAGESINDDVGLETEADVMGAKALQQG